MSWGERIDMSLASKKQYERVASIPRPWRTITVIVALVALAGAAASYYIFGNETTTKIILFAIGALALGVGGHFYRLQVNK